MKSKKLEDVINDIKRMNMKDKLKLGICMCDSNYMSELYDRQELLEFFDSTLREVDEEYRTTIINFSRCFNVMFEMSKIMLMTKEEQNRVMLYLYNNAIYKNKICFLDNYDKI